MRSQSVIFERHWMALGWILGIEQLWERVWIRAKREDGGLSGDSA